MNKSIFIAFTLFAVALGASSCHNSKKEFDNFEYSAVYFATQTPVRTLVMGEDIYDTSLDNQHKCKVYATMGGVYSNENQVVIDIEVDDTLCDNLYFEDGETEVKALPSSYYRLTSDYIDLDKSIMGGVVVEFTDDFFNDEKALTKNYVLPLLMTNVTNVDKILTGVAVIDNPNYFDVTNWLELPKNYVLYCVKYINKWDANYLRRGVDVITIGSADPVTETRGEEYVEYDEVCEVTTLSLTEASYQVKLTSGNVSKVCDLTLTFTGDDCVITCDDTDFTVSGTGRFVVDGEKNSWGNEDRNALYLDYTISTTIEGVTVEYDSEDTMVVRDRGIKAETFAPRYIDKSI